MDRLREQGFPLVERVEHWNAFARQARDLFGFADVLAVRGNHCLTVQSTSAGNVSARLRKISTECLAAVVHWLNSPARFLQVHGWAKRAGRWECRVVDVQLVCGQLIADEAGKARVLARVDGLLSDEPEEAARCVDPQNK